MLMVRRLTDDEARIQASLRDAAVVGTGNPGLQRPGYLRSSLRDGQNPDVRRDARHYGWAVTGRLRRTAGRRSVIGP